MHSRNPHATLQGYGVLVGSCFRSTPQIARILKANSARGVSLFAVVAELVAYSISCAYNLRLGMAFVARLETWKHSQRILHRTPDTDFSEHGSWVIRQNVSTLCFDWAHCMRWTAAY